MWSFSLVGRLAVLALLTLNSVTCVPVAFGCHEITKEPTPRY